MRARGTVPPLEHSLNSATQRSAQEGNYYSLLIYDSLLATTAHYLPLTTTHISLTAHYPLLLLTTHYSRQCGKAGGGQAHLRQLASKRRRISMFALGRLPSSSLSSVSGASSTYLTRQAERSGRRRDRRLGRRLASSSTRGSGWALRWPASSPRERHTAQRRRGRRAGALPRGALGPAKGGTLPPCCGACESSSPALT